MAESKKYYWLKLKRDFFKRHDIKIIESMPNGKEYILFYLKMLLESIDHEGELRFSETIPYNEQMLSVITNTNIDIVKSAMKMFIELNMIEVLEDSTIFMAEVEKLIGSETKWAEKKRLYRDKKDNVLSLSDKSKSIEIELDKDIDKEIKKKEIRHKYGEYKNVLFSDTDFDKLKKEFPSDWENRIERLSEYMASAGKSYENHLATIRTWARKENPTKSTYKVDELDNLINNF